MIEKGYQVLDFGAIQDQEGYVYTLYVLSMYRPLAPNDVKDAYILAF